MTGPSSINSVPLSYFQNGVGELQDPQNGQPVAPADQAQNQAPAGQPNRTDNLISQLDMLLVRAAKASTQSLDGKAMKTILQKLVADGALTSKSLKLLAKTADTAKKTMAQLDGFTGRQIASAINQDGVLDAESPVGQAIKAAIQAQNDLSDMLATLDKQLDALARHEDQVRQHNPRFRGVDTALQNEIVELRQLCDRRATEINRLAYQMHDFAVLQAAQGEDADPNITAILRAKVDELLPRQALAMHGTASSLFSLNEQVTARLRPLAERIESFRSDPKSTIDSEKFLALQSDINTMKAAVSDIKHNGIEVAGGRVTVPRDILRGMEIVLGNLTERFSTARNDVARKLYGNFLQTTKTLLSDSPENEMRETAVSEARRDMFAKRNAFVKSMATVMTRALDSSATTEEINTLLADLHQKVRDLKDAAGAVSDERIKVPETTLTIARRCRNITPLTMSLVGLIRNVRGSDQFLTGAEALSLFQGKLSVSSLVESRARGMEDADVDPANEDANIVSEKHFGAGNAGAVLLLERSDGEQVIFKGEAESRTGLASLAAGGTAYSNTQQTVDLNIASRKTAEALGMGGMIVKYTAGTHKGVFGFFMDKAHGRSAKALRRASQKNSSEAGLTAQEISALPPEQKRQIKADLMRELNRLQWLDLVTGQMDRHHDNYFIHVDRDTHKVTVTGIDNDASFSQMRTGAVTFALDRTHSEILKIYLGELATLVGSRRNVQNQVNEFLSDPGITIRSDGCITIDGAKIQNKALGHAIKNTLGIQSLAVPDKIDRQTYDALIALKSDPQRQAYLDSIRPRLSEGGFRAAISRLDDVIAQAEKLGREGKIIEKEPNGWLDATDTPLETGELFVKNQVGIVQGLGKGPSIQCNTAFCPSFFTRDKLDALFD